MLYVVLNLNTVSVDEDDDEDDEELRGLTAGSQAAPVAMRPLANQQSSLSPVLLTTPWRMSETPPTSTQLTKSPSASACSQAPPPLPHASGSPAPQV